MNILPVNNQTQTQIFQRGFISRIAQTFKPVRDETLKFVVKKPIAATGTFLACLGFVSGIIGKTAFRFLPVFGLPAIGLFIYQAFLPTHKGNKQVSSVQRVKEHPEPIIVPFDIGKTVNSKNESILLSWT